MAITAVGWSAPSAPRRGPPPIGDLLPERSPARILAEDGTLRPGAEIPQGLDAADLVALYRLMVVTREVDAEAVRLQRQGQAGFHCPCRGQEAAQVGSAYALGPDDWVFPQGREVGVAISRGLDPAAILHVWRGTWHAAHDPYAARFAFLTIPIATQCLHAAGFALGARLDRADTVAVCYVGDGGTSEGDFHEAVNLAAVHAAPCVFFVQNNGYAISVPVGRQTRAPTIAHKGIGYGVPGLLVDGNDVLACYDATARAVAHARGGHGPVLVEAVTYRMEGHSTSDDPTRYRDPEEVERWAGRDPLVRMQRLLRAEGLLPADVEEDVAAAAEDAAAGLRRAIFDAPAGAPTEVFDHLYSDLPAPLARQRDQLVSELGRRAGRRAGRAPGR